MGRETGRRDASFSNGPQTATTPAYSNSKETTYSRNSKVYLPCILDSGELSASTVETVKNDQRRRDLPTAAQVRAFRS